MKIRDHERILRETTESLRRQIAELTDDRDHWKQLAEELSEAHREAVEEMGRALADVEAKGPLWIVPGERSFAHTARGLRATIAKAPEAVCPDTAITRMFKGSLLDREIGTSEWYGNPYADEDGVAVIPDDESRANYVQMFGPEVAYESHRQLTETKWQNLSESTRAEIRGRWMAEQEKAKALENAPNRYSQFCTYCKERPQRFSYGGKPSGLCAKCEEAQARACYG